MVQAQPIAYARLRAANEIGTLYYLYSLLKNASYDDDEGNPWRQQWETIKAGLGRSSLPDGIKRGALHVPTWEARIRAWAEAVADDQVDQWIIDHPPDALTQQHIRAAIQAFRETLKAPVFVDPSIRWVERDLPEDLAYQDDLLSYETVVNSYTSYVAAQFQAFYRLLTGGNDFDANTRILDSHLPAGLRNPYTDAQADARADGRIDARLPAWIRNNGQMPARYLIGAGLANASHGGWVPILSNDGQTFSSVREFIDGPDINNRADARIRALVKASALIGGTYPSGGGGGGITVAQAVAGVHADLFEGAAGDPAAKTYLFTGWDATASAANKLTEAELRQVVVKEPAPLARALETLSGDERLARAALKGPVVLDDVTASPADAVPGQMDALQETDLHPVRPVLRGVNRQEQVTAPNQSRFTLDVNNQFDLARGRGSAVGDTNIGINGEPLYGKIGIEVTGIDGTNEVGVAVNLAAWGLGGAAPAQWVARFGGQGPFTLVKDANPYHAHGLDFVRYELDTLSNAQIGAITGSLGTSQQLRVDAFTDAAGTTARNGRPLTETVSGEDTEVLTEETLGLAPHADPGHEQLIVPALAASDVQFDCTLSRTQPDGTAAAGDASDVMGYQLGLDGATAIGAVTAPVLPVLFIEFIQSDYSTNAGLRNKVQVYVPVGWPVAPETLHIGSTTYALTRRLTNQAHAKLGQVDIYWTQDAIAAGDRVARGADVTVSAMRIVMADGTHAGSTKARRTLSAEDIIQLTLSGTGLVQLADALNGQQLLDYAALKGEFKLQVVTALPSAASLPVDAMRLLVPGQGQSPTLAVVERGAPAVNPNRGRVGFLMSTIEHGRDYLYGRGNDAEYGYIRGNQGVQNGPVLGGVIPDYRNHQATGGSAEYSLELYVRWQELEAGIAQHPAGIYLAVLDRNFNRVGTIIQAFYEADNPTITRGGIAFTRYFADNSEVSAAQYGALIAALPAGRMWRATSSSTRIAGGRNSTPSAPARPSAPPSGTSCPLPSRGSRRWSWTGRRTRRP